MKKFSVKLRGIFLVILSLLLVTCFGEQKNIELVSDDALAGYETSTSYLDNLGTETLDSIYSLADFYPLVCEHQMNSNFCWIYSSMKSLESAFMVQLGEYYNFSEVGLAYTSYIYDRDHDIKYANDYGELVLPAYFNRSGNFNSFITAYQTVGLILESDFSNDMFDEINSCSSKEEENYYSYVNGYSTTELNSYIKPYVITSKAATTEKIKRFVKKYGAVFTGIEGGRNNAGTAIGGFFKENNDSNNAGVNYFYEYDRNHSTASGYVALSGNHAVTIIGWNDEVVFGSNKGGFLAMNSWGFSTGQVELFYIPYSYSYLYSANNTIGGFICETPSNPSVSINSENSGSSSFTTDILTGSKELKNYFCYDDEIKLSFNLDLTAQEIAELDVRISSGNQDFTERFSISHSQNAITIELNKDSEFYGGYYTIDFYKGSTLFAKRSLYVYSATEIGNILICPNGTVEYNYYNLNNAFLNNNSSTTINVASAGTDGDKVFFMQMNLAPISNYSKILSGNKKDFWRGWDMQISDISVICSEDTTLQTRYTSEYLANYLFVKNSVSEAGNEFIMQIGTNVLSLSDFNNCLIKFKFSVSSVLYANCTRNYYINMYVSPLTQARTSDLYEITYVLNGGKNDVGNVTKYPDYEVDTDMTEVDLIAPSKTGYAFVGWYLNEDFSGDAVTTIDSSFSGRIKLYAKWQDLGVDYFDLSLVISEIKDHDGTIKTGQIIYGDTVKLEFEFLEKAFGGSTYQIGYTFFLDGDVLSSGTKANLSRNSSKLSTIFTINYKNLAKGEHSCKVVVQVHIGELTISEIVTKNVSVSPKSITFEFSQLSMPYNGYVQAPKVNVIGSFETAENMAEIYKLTCDKEAKNVGSYTFTITKILNDNYVAASDAETSCIFVITRKQVSVHYQSYSQIYDGKNHFPQYTFDGLEGNDTVTLTFYDVVNNKVLSECKNAGTYKVNIYSLSNQNYETTASDFEFEITRAKIKITLHATSDRVQTAPDKRKQPSFTVEGNFYSNEDIQIKLSTEARNATRSGKYSITCEGVSANYELEEVTGAYYTLTGFYYVYYQISNGSTYTERVEENKLPVGITKEDINAPKFSKISYSDDYIVTGDDIYVDVTLDDYSGYVYAGIFVGVFGVICLVYFIKKRESKVR